MNEPASAHQQALRVLLVAAGPVVLTLLVLIGLAPGHDATAGAEAEAAGCAPAASADTDPVVAAARRGDGTTVRRLVDDGAVLDTPLSDNPFVTVYDAALYASLTPYDTAALETLLALEVPMSAGVAERLLNRAAVALNPRALELLVDESLDASAGEASVADLEAIVPRSPLTGPVRQSQEVLGSASRDLLIVGITDQLDRSDEPDDEPTTPPADATICDDGSGGHPFPLIRAPGDDAVPVPPIAIAVVERDLGDLTQLLFHGADANTLVLGRWTPLALAAADCNVDAVTTLLRVDPDREAGAEGDRAGDLACPEVRDLLEASGTAPDSTGATP